MNIIYQQPHDRGQNIIHYAIYISSKTKALVQ